MISPQDINGAMTAAREVTAQTDQVCGSMSLADYRQHMTNLEEKRDALASVENTLKKTIDDLKHEEREVARMRKKVDDHHARTKAASNDIRFNRSTPQQ